MAVEAVAEEENEVKPVDGKEPAPMGCFEITEVDFEAGAVSEMLLWQLQRLTDRCFGEGEMGIDKAHERGWETTLISEVLGDGTSRLRGYICYELLPPPRAEFHIHRIAMHEGHRGRGLGQKLMGWALDKAAHMPASKCKWISLGALQSAVPFYEKLGFFDMGCSEVDEEQTWMELKNVSLVPDDEETDVEEEYEEMDINVSLVLDDKETDVEEEDEETDVEEETDVVSQEGDPDGSDDQSQYDDGDIVGDHDEEENDCKHLEAAPLHDGALYSLGFDKQAAKFDHLFQKGQTVEALELALAMCSHMLGMDCSAPTSA